MNLKQYKDQIKEKRNEYMKLWRTKNRLKIRKYNTTYMRGYRKKVIH